MTKVKESYAHLTSTLTDEMLRKKLGYCTYEDILRVSSKQDQQLTIEQFKDKGRYGTAPGFYRFHGSRLAPVYWKVSEVARYLVARYYNDKALLSRAAKAGFVVMPGTARSAGPTPRTRKAGDGRKKPPNKKVTLPQRKWDAVS